MNLNDIRVGSVVQVRGRFGFGQAVRGVVINIEPEITEGKPGIDYSVDSGDEFWAYLNQIDSVEVY